jgi:hypothetical protein
MDIRIASSTASSPTLTVPPDGVAAGERSTSFVLIFLPGSFWFSAKE